MNKYNQLTTEHRYTIAASLRQGLSYAETGRQIGFHRSSIKREVDRNYFRYDGAYRAEKADSRTRGRRSRSRRNQQFKRSDYRLVEKYLAMNGVPNRYRGG